jgi:hypothetical protein
MVFDYPEQDPPASLDTEPTTSPTTSPDASLNHPDEIHRTAGPEIATEPTPDPIALGRDAFAIGCDAFERGRYRDAVDCLEMARELIPERTGLGGEVKMWLVTAYEAAGDRDRALSLCRQACQHPAIETRQKARRLLAILEAPRLVIRPEWRTTIPDLAHLDEGDRSGGFDNLPRKPKSVPRQDFTPKPVDRSQVNLEDNRFIWVVLALTVAILLGWGFLA